MSIDFYTNGEQALTVSEEFPVELDGSATIPTKRKVYFISTGQYEDWRPLEFFSTEERAKEYFERFQHIMDLNGIHERDIDRPFPELPKKVWFYVDKRVSYNDECSVINGWIPPDEYFFEEYDAGNVCVDYNSDFEEMKKKAQERFYELKAQEEGQNHDTNS